MQKIVFFCVLSLLATSCAAQKKTIVVHEPVSKTVVVTKSPIVYTPPGVVISKPVVIHPAPPTLPDAHVVVRTKTVIPPTATKTTVVIRRK